jgi:hypothetical protein
MTALKYLDYFDEILNGNVVDAPYDNPDFLHYTKLNHSRQQRWFKNGLLSDELINSLSSIKEKQHWILITEPWCGDAAHAVPFIIKTAEAHELIELEIQLRDAEDSLIDNYLTNDSKSIPKLIVRNTEGKDLFTWGPRPVKCQNVFAALKEQNVDFDTLKTGLQKWYNEDKGECLQQEISTLLLSL